jgi:hypothetical protein
MPQARNAEQRAANRAAQTRWRRKHPQNAKKHDRASNAAADRRQLHWPARSNRAELMAIAAAAAGYTVLGSHQLCFPRFLWIDAHGRRHVEYLESEDQLIAELTAAKRIGIAL